MTVLTHIDWVPFGAPTREELAHDEVAKQHFLKYCDSGKCIRGKAHARKANWHEGLCLECAFNPYNMTAQREEGQDENKAHNSAQHTNYQSLCALARHH